MATQNKVSRVKTKAVAKAVEETQTNTPSNDVSDLLPKGDLKALSAEALGMSLIESEFFKKYKVEIKDAPKSVQTVHERMLKYSESMDVNVPIYSGDEGAQNQLYLFQTFMRALSLTDNQLFMAVDLVIAHIRNKLDTVFSSRMAYRFIKFIKRDAEEVNSYLKLLEIFLLISDPAKRNDVVSKGLVRATVAAIDPRYKDATFNLVTYLSQENI